MVFVDYSFEEGDYKVEVAPMVYPFLPLFELTEKEKVDFLVLSCNEMIRLSKESNG